MEPACSTPAVAVGKGRASEIPLDGAVVALLTAPGRSAVAVIGVEGPASVEILSRFFRPKGRPLASRDDGQIAFGQWGGAFDAFSGTDSGGIAVAPPVARLPPEDLVVVKRSSTSLEIHPHGGLAASERVLADLEAAGCRRLSWPEWLAATGCSEIEVEARVALAATTGPKAAAILCRQMSPLRSPRGHLPGESPREDSHAAPCSAPFGKRPGLLESAIDAVLGLAKAGNHDEACRRVDELLAWAPLGLRLTRPWRVVVKGSPNAGKSSLVNALAGFARSIVSSEPGTTRDLLETRIVLDGWEIDLIDTAGLRDDPASLIEQAGIDRAREAALAADLVLEVLDAVGGPKRERWERCDATIHASNMQHRGSSISTGFAGSGVEELKKKSPPLVILAKVDLLPANPAVEPSPTEPSPAEPSPAQASPADASPAQASPADASPADASLAEASLGDGLPTDAIRTSAVTGEGIDSLAAAIVRRLVPREPGPHDAVPFTPSQVEHLKSIAAR